MRVIISVMQRVDGSSYAQQFERIDHPFDPGTPLGIMRDFDRARASSAFEYGRRANITVRHLLLTFILASIVGVGLSTLA